MTKLSAIIIALNEADDLGACLASLSFCDEVVLLDGGSTDETASIARSSGARVAVSSDWPGFGQQKQRALALATGDWVLSIDADERIPMPLAAEIRAAIEAKAVDGYRINRLTSFLGVPLRHGGWHPDRILRLARRDKTAFTDDPVHEQMTVAGSVGDLQATMLHFSYASIAEVLDKQRRYALAGASVRRARHQRSGLGTALLRSASAFLRGYVLFGGFLDGAPGCVAAVARAQETFWRYLAVSWEPTSIKQQGPAHAGPDTVVLQDATRGSRR